MNESSSKDFIESQEKNNEIKDLKLSNCLVLDAPLGGKVYLIGTAHFSHESQKEVAELIKRVQPNRVVLELCNSRVNILNYDEETLMKEYKEMDNNKIIQLMKDTSVMQGALQALMIRLYAKVTEQLGMAPGGEFRVAYNEGKKIPGCLVILGDMPVKLTLSRGFNSLPWYRKLKLAWAFLTTDHNITKEDIEELKKKDMLDALMEEFGTSFPEFKRVLIDERNMFLTSSLKRAYQPIPNESVTGGFVPAKVVGVVGLGHLPGIQDNWNKTLDMTDILKIEEKRPSYVGKYLRRSIFIGTLTFIGYKIIKRIRI